MAILRNVILFLLLVSFSFAIDISSCTNISYPGSYVLTQSLSGVNASAISAPVPACIYINSSSVTFSCGEATRYNISSNASIPSSRGILVLNSSSGALTNVVVTNCTSGTPNSGISGYDYGFDTSFSGVIFQDSTVYNTTYGTQIDSNDGNRVEFLNLTILNSTSLSSTTGLFVSSSSNVLIENSSFLNLRAPVTLSSSNFTNFTSNFLNNTIEPGLSGVVSVILGQNILISSNNLSYTNSSSALPAIRLSSTEYSTISSNRLTYDQGDLSSYGIDVSTSSHNNNITNNYVHNYTRGIILGNGVENNTVSGNTIFNTTYGIRFGIAQISTINSNNISNSNFSIIFITSSSSSASGLVTINSNNLSNGDSGVYLYENIYNTSSNYIINVSNNFAHNFTNGFYARMTNASIYFNNNTANMTSNSGFYFGRSFANSSYNRVTNALGDGYLLNGSIFQSYFYHNNASSPSRNGFAILSSANTSILGGNISGSLIDGIFVNQSANTTINQTLVSGSFVTGANVLTAPDSTILDSVRFYNNPLDLRVNHSGAAAAATLLLSNVIFDSASGSLQNYSNVSLYDQLSISEEYTMNWSEVPASLPNETFSFQNTYLNITNLSSVSIDSLNLSWLESDLGSYNESRFVLYKYNSSGWFPLSSSPETSLNRIGTSSLSSFSVFAILQNNSTISSSSPSSSPSGGGSSTPVSSRYDFDARYTCLEGLRLSVENTRGVRVSSTFSVFDSDFNELDSGSSDSDGYYYYSGASSYCGQTLRLRARFSSGTLDRSFSVDCSSCAPRPECTVDTDCSSGYMCSSNRCVLIPPRPECTVDSDCSSTSICSSNRCVAISCPSGRIVDRVCVPILDNATIAPECTSDASCASDSYCARGPSGAYVCTSISTEGRCGEIQNHQFVSFQCGSSPSCSACPSNYTCSNNRCVGYSLNAPERGIVGSQIDVFALLGETPASGSSIRITSPDGTASTLRTDLNGRVRQLFGVPGVYRFDLIQNGTIVKSVTVTSVPRRGSPLDDLLSVASGSVIASLPWLLLLLLIGLGVYYYYRRMKKN